MNYKVAPGDTVDRLVESGLAEIRRAIDHAHQAKYPGEGERDVLRKIVDKAITDLSYPYASAAKSVERAGCRGDTDSANSRHDVAGCPIRGRGGATVCSA